MIISDKHKFVFIHIPKCAGSFLRRIINEVDTSAYSPNFVKDHPALGKTDYTHIPLSVLEKHFPEAYKKTQEYFSFCIIRNPYDRLPSSIAQHLKMYKSLRLTDLSKIRFKAEVEKVIGSLEKHKNSEYLPYDFIHFQKQISYVFNGGNKIVENVYTIENVESVFVDLSSKTGLEISVNNPSTGKKANNSKVFRNNALGYMFKMIKPYSSMVLKHSPWNFKGKISQYMYLKPKEKFHDILSSAYVKDFIDDYYRDDIKMYESKSEQGKAVNF